jgi:Asp/Glu/hydantoin racemase
MSSNPRIVLLHATPLAMEPIMQAMVKEWPQARPMHLLDDSLMVDRAKEGADLSNELTQRFLQLGRYSHSVGAAGIIFTCSAFGPAIERVAAELPIPVLKPNEAMFGEAQRLGRRVALIATFPPSIPTMKEEFLSLASKNGSAATLDVGIVPGALDALRRGDADAHNLLIAGAAEKFSGYDAIMLAQFSMAGAAQVAQARVDVQVLTAPTAAVLRMRQLIEM